jgi:cobalt-zinc-cadmium efflux system protein
VSSHHHHAPLDRREPAFIVALAITLAYALVELAGGIWSGSIALLSDAGHMFSDALALGLAAVAARLAQRPVGHSHSYGWARAEVIGAMLNCLIMLGIVVMLVVEAIQRLLAPQPVIAGGVMLIALVGLVVNGVVAFMLSRSEHNMNARAALIHVMGDLLSSLAALVAGAVIFFTGWIVVDPILSLVISGLILVTTWRLLRDTLHVLMEGVPASIELAAIGKALAEVQDVISVHDLHVWSITPRNVALSAHLEISSMTAWPDILRASRGLLHDRFGIEHVTLQPEQPAGHDAIAVVRVWPNTQRPHA